MSQSSKFPHTLLLILGLVVLAQILTFLLPAGDYDEEPRPDSGTAFAEAEAATSLRERLAQTRETRGVSTAQLAELFQVAELTVVKWEAGPGDGETIRGTHIEANVGSLLDTWVETAQAPTQEALDAWKSAVPGRTQIVPGSYHTVDSDPLHWTDAFTVFMSVPRGLMAAGDIIFFVFVIGGVIGIMRATGAFDALIGASIRNFGRSPSPLVISTISLFAFGSGLIGMAEEYVPFIPLLVTMSLAMGLDAMVGISIVFVGYAVGYGCAPINPFTVLIGQDIAGLPPTSGWLVRAILLLVCLVVGVHHVLRYAKRIQADPNRSLVADIDYSSGFELPEGVPLTRSRILVLVAFAATVVTFVYGVSELSGWGWYFNELAAIFLGLGVLTPILVGMCPNKAAKHFCVGAAELTTTALLIGFARTIQVVLEDGQVIDTVVNGIASSLQGLGAEAGAVGMLLVQTLCNFFIPSGSGQAYVTMPIMAPLADELGIQRQVAVLAYQFGDGFTNVITPTNAAFMGMLAMARVPYERWLRFAIPLMLKLYAIAALALVLAVMMGYS